MEKAKQVSGSSSSSFTMDLFGPKESSKSSSSSSSSGLFFGSVFGPSSTGLGRDSSHSGNTGLLRKQDLGRQYGNAKHETSDYISHRSRGEDTGVNNKNKSSISQNEAVDPCYFSSSIYYGGQEVYSPTNQITPSHHVFKKDEGDVDSNGNNSNCVSRGNWWQGSLYY